MFLPWCGRRRPSAESTPHTMTTSPSTRSSSPAPTTLTGADAGTDLDEILHLHGQRLLRVARIRAGVRAEVPEGRLWAGVRRRLRGQELNGSAATRADLLEQISRAIEAELRTFHEGRPASPDETGSFPLPVPARIPTDADLELYPAPDRGLPEEQQLDSELDGALVHLPAEERRLVELIDYCDCPMADAASELGISPKAARILYARAWARLRRQLTGRLPEIW